MPADAVRPRRRVHAVAVWVLVLGVAATIGLVVAARTAFENNEDRLLQQRTAEAGAVLTAAIPGIQTPLASAVAVAEEDGGDTAVFSRLMTPLVENGTPYVSASLWRADGSELTPLVVVGEEPKLASQPPEMIRAYLERSVNTTELAVIGLLEGANPRLGYSFTSPEDSIDFVAYAEAALPEDRTAAQSSGSAFEGLDFAIYLGPEPDLDLVLTATTSDLPLKGRRAAVLVDFGDTTLLVRATPNADLGGGLFAALPWLVGLFGALTTLVAGALLERLARRRDLADDLATENLELYRAQLSVARTLQQSLLPQRLPTIAGLDVAARYVPGVADLEIGGDWYDVIELDGDRLMVVAGDVSGRGLQAGTLMASLRFSIRALAARGDEPGSVLSGLTRLISLEHDGHFATVVCMTVDLASRVVTIANAGHPDPLVIDASGVSFLSTTLGPPVGVTRDAQYAEVTHQLPDHATLLCFTDGLFERRGETIDVGLERLRRAVPTDATRLDDVLDGILSAQISGESHDDSAIIGVRWTTN